LKGDEVVGVEFYILAILTAGPNFANQIYRDLIQITGQNRDISTVYKALHRMRKKKLVYLENGYYRKTYTISDKGQACFGKYIEDFRDALKTVEHLTNDKILSPLRETDRRHV
jgi:DNA-binding PadR family transcriptional regulator